VLCNRRKERKVPEISNGSLICFLPHDGRIKAVTCRSSSMCKTLPQINARTLVVHYEHGTGGTRWRTNFNTSVIIAMLSSVSRSNASRINIFSISWLVGINFVSIWDLSFYNFNCLAYWKGTDLKCNCYISSVLRVWCSCRILTIHARRMGGLFNPRAQVGRGYTWLCLSLTAT
jgi:hypothetical protein